MRSFLFITGLLGLLAARPALAQPNESLRAAPPLAASPAPRKAENQLGSLLATPPASVGGPRMAPDTVAALHHLFARYRGRRLRVAVGTLLVGSGLTIANAASVRHANDPLEAGFQGFGAILAGTLTAVLVPVDFVALGRVSRRHEQLAIEQWRAHQLPAAVRQALRPKDFELATS